MSEALSRMAAAAVEDIVKDLCDRRGLRQEWEGIGDEAIYAEIKKSWADIIRERFLGDVLGELTAVLDRENPICGHKMADLHGGPGAVTRCGACQVAKRNKTAQADDLLTQALLGPCSKCGEKFDAGQAIMQTSEGERFMHAECPRDVKPIQLGKTIGVLCRVCERLVDKVWRTSLQNHMVTPLACADCHKKHKWEPEAAPLSQMRADAPIVVKPADGYRLPDPTRPTGSCAGCGKPIYDELWHQRCAPKAEAQPIIPPWMRELGRLQRGFHGPAQYRIDGRVEYERMQKLEALAKLRAVVLAGKGEAEVPDIVAAVRMHQGGTPPTSKLTARRYGGMEGVSFALDGVDYCYSPVGMVLEDIDAAGAEVCK